MYQITPNGELIHMHKVNLAASGPTYNSTCKTCARTGIVVWEGECTWCKSKIGPDFRRTQPLYHIRVAINKSSKMSKTAFEAAKDMLHVLMRETDSDYPVDPMRKPADRLLICEDCKGLVWRNPQLTPSDFKRGAKQLGLQCKVRQWREGTKCSKPTITSVAFSNRYIS